MPALVDNSPELTTEQVVSTLIAPLEAASVVLAAGPTIYDTPGRPVRLPKLVGSTEPSWVGEGELIPDSDVDFGELTLLPDVRPSVKVLTKFSAELARSSVVGLSPALQARMVKDVSDKLDDAFLIGDGALNTVTGLANQPGILTGDLNTGDIDSLHDAVGQFYAVEVPPTGARWFVNSADFVAFRKIKATDGNYIVRPDVTADAVFVMLGIPVTVTNKLPVGTALLVNMPLVAVARDLAPSVKFLAERYAEFDMLAIRVVSRWDLGLMHPEAVVKLTTAI